jgi:hypothetical protein
LLNEYKEKITKKKTNEIQMARRTGGKIEQQLGGS